MTLELESIKKTARSWDSFAKALNEVMTNLKPKRIFEFGPGASTKIMAKHDFVEHIDTVEHDQAWFFKYIKEMPDRVNMMLVPSLDRYPHTLEDMQKEYDLIFVDGKCRPKCLNLAKKNLTHTGVVMIHDAERSEYQEAINNFNYIYFTDNGSTAVLTDNPVISEKIDLFLSSY